MAEPPARPKAYRAANLRLALFWGAAALVGLGLVAVSQRSWASWIWAVLDIFAVQAAVSSLGGVFVNAAGVTAPRVLLKFAPILVAGRVRTPLAEINDLTALGKFLGFDVVGLTGVEGQLPMLFSKRESRLAFFEALRAYKPDVRIYRAF